MAVCLKILGFTIWMTIMMVLIHGSNQRKSTSSQQLCLRLSDDDEIERLRRKNLSVTNLQDRMSLKVAL